MSVVYVSFANTYTAINEQLKSIALKSYHDNPDFFEAVVTSLIDIVVSRRRHGHSASACQEWLFSNVSHCFQDEVLPLLDDEQLRLLSSSKEIWDAIDEELCFTPSSAFMAWVVNDELWKILI